MRKGKIPGAKYPSFEQKSPFNVYYKNLMSFRRDGEAKPGAGSGRGER
jgi:hypothetical protein